MNIKERHMYTDLLSTVEVKKWKSTEIVVNKIRDNLNVYNHIASDVKMDSVIVGIIHGLEASFNFNTHLHNGDPLTAKTVHVPKDRPDGEPPFHWRESATDALEPFRNSYSYSWEKKLSLIERYNGLGYRKKDINSPYLWSGTNHYTTGKYISDGSFDPNTRSRQVGAVAILLTFKPIYLSPKYRLGDSGPQIKKLQRFLGDLKIDGHFGPKTQKAMIHAFEGINIIA